MAMISKLIEKLANWQDARDALEELSASRLEIKRAEVYPKVIEVAVEYWCEREGPSDCGYELERIVEFFIRELAVHPVLSSELYAAMPHAPKYRLYHFYNFVRAARDARAHPLLRGSWRSHTFGWGDAAIAIHGASLAPDPLGDPPLAGDALAALETNPMYNDLDLATAAAILAGERAIAPLHALHRSKGGHRKDAFGLGLALAGDDDEVFFKALSTKGEGASAKRIFTITHKPKQKDRLAALEALGKNAGDAGTYVSPATLLFASRLLLDDDPVIAARAAKLLAEYPGPRGEHQLDVHHAYFLVHARQAIARGVSPAMRALLETVQRSIPRAPPFGAGPTAPVAKPEADPRKENKERRAREALDAMGVAPAASKAKAAATAKTAKAAAKNPGATAGVGKPGSSGTGATPKFGASKSSAKAFGASLGALAAATGSRVPDALPSKAATHRNAELEAGITQDPADRARFLVYGDWLQQQGDARGALIALHDKADQGDKTAADAAALLLHEHRHALLGLLDGVDEIELDWELGFIRQARLRYASQRDLQRGLEKVFAADSARFLQSIAIDPIERKTPETGPIIEMLLERAPKTLAQLQIGKPGAFAIPAELFAAFPRLQRDPAVVWAEVTEAIAEQRKLKVDLAASKLPALVSRVPGVEADPTQVLVGLKAELDKQRPLGVVAALLQVFTRDSLDRFAHGMLIQWNKEQRAKWAFDAVGALGGDACAAFLGAHLAEWSHQRAVQACEHLRRIGTDLAVCELAGLVLRPNGAHPRRLEARQLLEKLAGDRGIGVDTLLVRACPTELPTTGGRLAEMQRDWFMQLMVDGIRISAADFRRHVAEHPLRRPLAATLLWATYSENKLIATFAVARADVSRDAAERENSLRAVDGAPFTLDDQSVGLVHPVELPPDQLDAWRATFERREIAQVIRQLDRPVFTLTHQEGNLDKLEGFAKRRVGFYAIRDGLTARDWVGVNDSDGGGTDWFERRFDRDSVTIVADLGSTMGSIGAVRIDGSRNRSFGSLHRVTVSELLYDLEIAHGYRERTPQARRDDRSDDRSAPRIAAPRNAPTGPGPIVERAKTGRSKCVVCETAIAKGDPRVGVERLIETDTFTGRGTVWSHPKCRDGMPELEGINVDELIATL